MDGDDDADRILPSQRGPVPYWFKKWTSKYLFSRSVKYISLYVKPCEGGRIHFWNSWITGTANTGSRRSWTVPTKQFIFCLTRVIFFLQILICWLIFTRPDDPLLRNRIAITIIHSKHRRHELFFQKNVLYFEVQNRFNWMTISVILYLLKSLLHPCYMLNPKSMSHSCHLFLFSVIFPFGTIGRRRYRRNFCQQDIWNYLNVCVLTNLTTSYFDWAMKNVLSSYPSFLSTHIAGKKPLWTIVLISFANTNPIRMAWANMMQKWLNYLKVI